LALLEAARLAMEAEQGLTVNTGGSKMNATERYKILMNIVAQKA